MIDLNMYRSPEHEESFYKNIPIQHLAEVQNHFRHMKGMRYVFRGPREGSLACYCLKSRAKTFAVYKTNWY